MNVDHLRTFGKYAAVIRPEDADVMTPAKWKQTLRDMPVVIGAGAVGWGVGRTLADVVAERYAGPTATSGAKYAPLLGNILSASAGYAAGRMQSELRKRRDAAERAA